MKLKNYILGVFSLTAFFSVAQDDAAERECMRLKKVAQVARLERKDFKESSAYMLKAEAACKGLDAKNMGILIGSLKNSLSEFEAGTPEYNAYMDTLLGTWDRAEKGGTYDDADDLMRAYYIANQENANRVKADSLFQVGIKKNGAKTQGHFITFYYYNLYNLYANPANGTVQKEYKQRLISDFFELTDLIHEANMGVAIEEGLRGYIDAAIPDAESLLPSIKEFVEGDHSDPGISIPKIKQFISLLEDKSGTKTAEYEQLVLLWDRLDPSLDSKLAKAKVLMNNDKYGDARKAYNEIIELTDDDDIKQEALYGIALCHFKSRSYKSAYSAGLKVGGKFKGKGLSIAGQSVGQNADNCGVSTFERQCNYYYAVELLEKAQANGEKVGSTISGYKKRFPSDAIIFENGDPSTVTLECYGVTVNVVKQ